MKNKIIKIALIGKTNAGKSTLINKIVGEKISIQNKKINTTLDLIVGVKNIKHIQMIFYDTPGSNFLKTFNSNSKTLKINLWQAIDDSDVILYLIDSKTIKLKFLFDQLNKLEEVNKKKIIVFNKIDLVSSKNILPFVNKIDSKYNIEAFFSISGKKNKGIDNLLKFLNKFSYNSKWIYKEDELTNKGDEFIISELLRETILTYLHKEIPYNIDIKTTEYKFLKNNNIKIKQKILINENRYKKIIVGKKGIMIKKIREECQQKISDVFKKRTHLYLEVINA